VVEIFAVDHLLLSRRLVLPVRARTSLGVRFRTVTTVTGGRFPASFRSFRLREGVDAVDLLAATFPGGSITGAPKIRSMEIIEELEPERRGPYAGAVGYFGFSGNMDFCITIRTIIMRDNDLWIQAGAGIVADSEPVKEFEETLNKARGLRRAVELAEKGL